jgi:hypothetical protein
LERIYCELLDEGADMSDFEVLQVLLGLAEKDRDSAKTTDKTLISEPTKNVL